MNGVSHGKEGGGDLGHTAWRRFLACCKPPIAFQIALDLLLAHPDAPFWKAG